MLSVVLKMSAKLGARCRGNRVPIGRCCCKGQLPDINTGQDLQLKISWPGVGKEPDTVEVDCFVWSRNISKLRKEEIELQKWLICHRNLKAFRTRTNHKSGP